MSGAGAILVYARELGARPHLLDRHAATFGTGSTGAANALYVASGVAGSGAGPAVVSRPPAGWVPWPLVPADWSAEFPAGVVVGGAPATA